MKKNILFMVFGAVMATVVTIGVYAINASEIDYRNNKSVEDAIDDLYTTQNTTVSTLTEQNASLRIENSSLGESVTQLASEKSELQLQLNSLSTASRSFSFVSGTSTQTFNLGFRPDYITCFAKQINNNNTYVIAIYNKDFSSTNLVTLISGGNRGNETSISVATWYVLSDTGFTWNITSNNFKDSTVYCTASK